MMRIDPSGYQAIYDSATDVMYFALGSSRFTDEEEILPGIHVLFAYDQCRLDEIVGIEVEHFKEKYGSLASIEVPTDEPLSIKLDPALLTA